MIDNLESRLHGLLPKESTSNVDLKVQEVTRELIKAGENAYNTSGYTHSVCHLFETYGRKGYSSYLNSKELFPIAEELVNFTLKKAMKSGNFGCVERIINPIMDLNLAHLEENLEGFTFKPSILTDEKFIETYAKTLRPGSYGARFAETNLEFCKSKKMKDFFTKYTEFLRNENKLGLVTNDSEITPGVFIDVDNTLLTYKNEYSSDLARDPITEMYGIMKLYDKVPVIIFTGGDPVKATEKLKAAGVDKELCNVKSKTDYIGKILEICVDDTAPGIQGFRAKNYYKTGKQAWDAEYSGRNKK